MVSTQDVYTSDRKSMGDYNLQPRYGSTMGELGSLRDTKVKIIQSNLDKGLSSLKEQKYKRLNLLWEPLITKDKLCKFRSLIGRTVIDE